MSDELDLIALEAKDNMQKAIGHLEVELGKIRAGKASPQMLEGIFVDYYGAPTALNQIANVSAIDARTLSIQPWEKNMVQPIEKAIIAANMGINPQNDGAIIRIFFGATEERRRELVKRVNAEAELSKVAIRSIRRDSIEAIKKLQKDGLSEDIAKDAEAGIQEVTNKYISLIDKHGEAKEKRNHVYVNAQKIFFFIAAISLIIKTSLIYLNE